MRKTLLTIILGAILALSACNFGPKYNLEIDSDIPVVNILDDSYHAGKKISIQLFHLSNYSYKAFVNGEEIEFDQKLSTSAYIYYSFVMPEEDVAVIIEATEMTDTNNSEN